MGLTIEVSFCIYKNPNITQFKQYLSSLATKYNAISHYFIHEIDRHNTTIDRNDCIHVVEFQTTQIKILDYIKTIMQNRNVKIDSIYQDKKRIDLIYASKKYLSTMSVYGFKPIKPISKTNLLQLVAAIIS